MSSSIGHADPELPDIDDRLVTPDSGYEIDDGKLVRVPPALEPHAIQHSKLSALLEAYVTDEFQVAIDMLIRTSELSDRAPDASVFPRARDPVRGRRQLDHLSFEVVSTEKMSYAAKKASDLAKRGVRRVIAIDVEHVRALEWSKELETWSPLDPSGSIEDRCFVAPLPIADLVSAANADDAVARALLAKGNPVLVAAIVEGEARGRAEGLAQAVVRVLVGRGIDVGDDDRARILAEHDLARLEVWLTRALSCTSVADLVE